MSIDFEKEFNALRELFDEERKWQRRLSRKRRDWSKQTYMNTSIEIVDDCVDCGESMCLTLPIDAPEDRDYMADLKAKVEFGNWKLVCDECLMEFWYAILKSNEEV